MERTNFYGTLYKKAHECTNSGDLSDNYDIYCMIFSLIMRGKLPSLILRNSLIPKDN